MRGEDGYARMNRRAFLTWRTSVGTVMDAGTSLGIHGAGLTLQWR
jgi:hypothetical protein